MGGLCAQLESPSTAALHTKVLNVIIEIPDKKFPSDVRNLTSGALSTRYSLISNFLFSICILQVGSADLCNLWCEARSVALENARREWLQAEVTGCDNFCLADKHRQNHSSFLFSITMNSALGCQCSFMCPYSLWDPVLLFFFSFFFSHNTTVKCCLPFCCCAACS